MPWTHGTSCSPTRLVARWSDHLGSHYIAVLLFPEITLAATAYIANFTASTPETSLVGNVLDKGIGLYRHRVEDLLGVEVVTGAGDLVHVGGYWPMGRAMFSFPSGLGPTLTALFLQSNFGIVTACALKLLPRPETIHILYATLAADRLAQAITVLKQLRWNHALNSVIKLYNSARLPCL
jgi:4-cresol dehydrogenase (hydroxylating)